ncbi:MAG: PDDEXK nuclease domain-containing protein [Lachnospiraceae bacterium]
MLEFLGLIPNDDFYESDLEQALITFTEISFGTCWRIFICCKAEKNNIDGRHFRIDLVFYNYILKCFVLIDLKVGDFNTSGLRADADVCSLL